MNTIEQALSKIVLSLGYNNDFKCENINQCVRQLFQSHAEYIICIENIEELDDIMHAQNESVIIILFLGDDNDDSEDHREVLETFNFRQDFYELRTIISISDLQGLNKWCGNVISRHGKTLSCWWSQKQNEDYVLQIENVP